VSAKIFDEKFPAEKTIHNLLNKIRQETKTSSIECLMKRSWMTQQPDFNMHLENH
jgi:hypothetical protein